MTRGVVVVALLLVALVVLPETLGGDWISTLTSVAIYSVVAAGLVVLYGKVGMISLGQIALLGARHLDRRRGSTSSSTFRFPLLLLATGAITCAVGVLIGLPALRLSGLYLALITLMGAGALTIILRTIEFPNGGAGIHRPPLGGRPRRTSSRCAARWEATTDTSFYRYTVIVCALMFVLALVHFVIKPGRAWAAIRESEPAALAAGRQHHALQDVGVRARIVHDGGGRAACSRRRWATRPSTGFRRRTR